MRANPCWPKCGGRFRAHKLRGRERLCWRWPSPSSLTQSCLIYRIDVCRLRLRCVEWQRRVARLVTTWAAEGGRGAVAEHGEVLRDATPSRHSDPGTQYTSVFGRRCREMSVRTSMGSVGNAHQNAIAESFFASLEYELLGRHALQKHVRGRTRYALTRRRAVYATTSSRIDRLSRAPEIRTSHRPVALAQHARLHAHAPPSPRRSRRATR